MHSSHLLLEEPIRMATILEPSKASFFPAMTKIVGTLGPRSRSVEVISSCLKAGMSVMEFSERLSYFGIATSLIIYLTKVIGQDLKTAARNVNYWSGVTTMIPLIGGFLADSYLGRFHAVLVSSIIYLMGLFVMTLSRVVPGLKPCSRGVDTCPKARDIHVAFFFLALYLISIGTGGHKPSLESFGADQFDDDHPGERKKKMSFFNWWNTGLCAGVLLGVTVIVYVQDHVSWAAADVTLTIVMGLTLVVFWVGRPFYRFRRPTGSPFTPLARVAVAAFVKRKLPCPSGSDGLYEVPKGDKGARGRLLFRTDRLKFLDKAAIIEPDDHNPNPWRLATVTQVEEMKLVVHVIPIWFATMPFAISLAQGTTFFIKQGTTLDRHLGHDFLLPPASIFGLAAIAMIAMITIYDYALEPLARRIKGRERGITVLQRIGVGMAINILAMLVAAVVERRRLDFLWRHGSSASMSIFWLAPQFLLYGIGDGFAIVGLQEFFYDQVPDSMRSLGIALYLSVLGAANFLSSLLITVVDRVSGKVGKSWFGKDLNSSRIDYFYWLLAGITALDVCVFAVIASRYTYKNVSRTVKNAVADCYEGDGDGVEAMA
ncbi:major facilitator superfamily protein [Striga asiatica]|uniref:Major facilitator superfamily protein n=1 Tax=Striga asiatica TaxID=4170 RepID=A0A5A7RFA4_STRAF|nr:major facilitator superfamily protein [Striga asiatica]